MEGERGLAKHVMFSHRTEKEGCDGDVTSVKPSDSHVHIGKMCEKQKPPKSVHCESEALFCCFSNFL